MEILVLVMMILLIIFVLALSVFVYVMSSLALYTAAVKKNINNPWLSWIPIGNQYIIYKLGNISSKFIYLYIPFFISYIATCLLDSSDIGVLYILSALITCIISCILTISIYVAYFKIAKEFNISIALTIIMIFISILIIPYSIILYENAKKLNEVKSI